MVRVNVGCGTYYAPGWVNVDAWSDGQVRPDVVADARSLPFGDGTAEMVYLGHVAEHVPFDDVPVMFGEVRRVLADGGRVCVVGPDYDRAVGGGYDEALLDVIRFGGHDWPGVEHLWVSTGALVLEAVTALFPDAVDVPIVDVPDVWPVVSRIGWQCAVTASKE